MSIPTAIVTGASRGLGLALSHALASRGWRLVIDARGARALEEARRELARSTEVAAIPGDISEYTHRVALVDAAGPHIDLLVNNASVLGPSPQPSLGDYPLPALDRVLAVNLVAPLGLVQLALPRLSEGARVLNITSDAAVEPYPGWGGYGAAKAALHQVSAVLSAQRPELRVYAVDPGDMRTQLHQEAFPDEDISDRPPPEDSVPGLLTLIEGSVPSGRYQARELVPVLR